MSVFSQYLEPGRSSLWLDYIDYGARLFAGPASPWEASATTVSWIRKTQNLLESDVLSIPLWTAISSYANGNRALQEEMTAKSRKTYALKALLANHGLRDYLVELVSSLKAAQNNTPVCILFPSPTAAISAAEYLAGESATDLSPEDSHIDAAALYIADFLRIFGNIELQALLLVESPGSIPEKAQQNLYRSVLNVANTYSWHTGLYTPAGTPDEIVDSFDFAVAQQQTSLPTWIEHGVDIGEEICDTLNHRCYTRIPEKSDPEAVLAAIKQMRRSSHV